MKRAFYILLAVLACSCSGQGGRNAATDKAIEAAVLQNAPGDKDAYKFKILEFTEQGAMTVADSIKIITEQAVKKQTDGLQADIVSVQKMQAQARTAADRETLDAMIAGYRKQIDSLHTATHAVPVEYEGRDHDQVLVSIVRCRYQTTDPQSGSVFKETFDFYLSPNGKTVYRKMKAGI